jgi:4-hydroxy-tetrahydrodipicolinate reductase
MEEVHHTQKLDAPSGTAISLANGIIENSNFTNWTLDNPTASDTTMANKRSKFISKPKNWNRS